MPLTVSFTDFNTGRHRYCPGDTWKAQDGPGRPWLETLAPIVRPNGLLAWGCIGRDLEAEQVRAIADCVDMAIAIAGCKTHKEAKQAARRGLEAAGLWELVQAQAGAGA